MIYTIKEIEEAYNTGNPIITDFEYDKLQVVKEADSLKSMSALFEYHKLQEFLLKNFKSDFIIEPKIDGISLLLKYSQGKLIFAQTKGNNITVQKEIFNSVLNIENIPKTIDFYDDLIVRGELTIDKNFYLEYLQTQFSSPRSCVCSSIYSKDLSLIKERKIQFIAFYFNTKSFDSSAESKEFFQQMFAVTPNLSKEKHPEQLLDELINYNFFCDGIVFKLDSEKERNIMGETDSDNRWEIAFKRSIPALTAKVIDIHLNATLTGKQSPIATITPIVFDNQSNIKISHVSLNNIKTILSKKIGIGSEIIVELKSLAIPILKQVVIEKEFIPPNNCVSCHSLLNNEWVCENYFCNAKISLNLEFIFKKLKFRNFGIKNAKLFSSHCKDVIDLLNLTSEKINHILTPKKAQDFYEQLKIIKKTITSKNILSCYLGRIPMLTMKHLNKLEKFSFFELKHMTEKELISHIGKISGTNLYNLLYNTDIKEYE